MVLPTQDLCPSVLIYTDGSCSGNPGPGGWAAILRREDGQEREISGHEPHTTNMRMELTAAVRALRLLGGTRVVTLRSDSSVLVEGMTEWVSRWQEGGWRKSGSSKPVENADLWRQLLAAAEPHEVTWEWVKGHAADALNLRADRLAVAACRRC